MIRIILADDHHLIRQGIRSLLEKTHDIEIVAEAEDGYQALNLTRELEPDLLVTDIDMPRLSGIQAADQLKQAGITTKVIILSMHSDRLLVQQALRCGVRGYLLKHSVLEELLLAIRAAIRGELYLSSVVSQLVTSQFYIENNNGDQSGTAFDQLTNREIEVLKLAAEGHTNKAIAKILHISVKTVEKHRTKLMRKLDVHDLAALVRIAIKYGLVFVND